MAVVGYGIDVVDVKRFESVWKRFGNRLLTRVFSDDERDWCLSRKSPANHLAVRFGAKEAFVKAIGSRSGLRWKDIEIVREESGRPHIKLSGKARAIARKKGVKSSFVTLAHDAGVCIAGVIIEN